MIGLRNISLFAIAATIACGGGDRERTDGATELSAGECSDGIDNDGDGSVDCDDVGCASHSFCVAGETDGGAADSGPATPCPAPTGATTHVFVLSRLEFAYAPEGSDPEVVAGFNLDGRVSEDTDAQGCFHPDFTGPPPDNNPGVDNQWGPSSASTGLGPENLAAEMALTAEVSGIDDLVSDPTVSVRLFYAAAPGGGDIERDGAGAPVTCQQVIEDAAAPMTTLTGSITDGRLEAGPAFGFAIHTALEDGTPWSFPLDGVRIRFNIAPEAIDAGVMGGSTTVDDAVAAVVAVGGEDIPETLARSIFEGQADLFPDGAGECQSISSGFTLEGVPVGLR